jgi:hypothetical protein
MDPLLYQAVSPQMLLIIVTDPVWKVLTAFCQWGTPVPAAIAEMVLFEAKGNQWLDETGIR